MGEDSVLTELMQGRQWYRPVASRDELPTENLRDGEMCLAVEEGAVYEVRNGEWTVLAEGVDLG